MLMDNISLIIYKSLITIVTIQISKELLKIDNRRYITKNLLLFIFLCLSNILFSNESYIIGVLIFKIIVLAIVIKKIFNIKLLTAIATGTISSIIIIVAETFLIISSDYDQNNLINDSILITLINGVIICLISYCISKIIFIKEVINSFLKLNENAIKKSEIALVWFSLVIIFFFYYLVLLSRYSRINQFTLILILIISCMMFIIYIINTNKYNRLIKKYNNVLDYACAYEEELEKDMLLRHEHKNQLAVIKGLSKNKKVNNYIDEILKSSKKDKNLNINGINKLPKGGIRGLIYYKICCIKKKNINYSLDISKNIKDGFTKVSEQNKKILSYILGVFLDNAIEECNECLESNISIEIYLIDDYINIIVANTLTEKININKIGKKGYSTKGKNRGNGIFLIANLIKDNKDIKTNNKVINNYFIQEINIKIK